MILYIIKSSLCLVVLLGIYFLFLEREKMHRFNRFFLLGALLLGLSIPFYSIETGSLRLITEAPAEVVATVSTSSSQFIEKAIEPNQVVNDIPETTSDIEELPVAENRVVEDSKKKSEVNRYNSATREPSYFFKS